MEKYKIDKKVFSAADLSAILMGLSSLSSIVRGEELVGALAKVKRFIPPGSAKDIALKANQIHIDLGPWMDNENIQHHLERIKAALQEGRLLSFGYADRYGNKTARTAEPYQLVLKDSQWYFHGYCLERGDFRLFRLSRMANLQIQKQSFALRDYPAPRLDFADVLAAMQTTVKLRIHQSMMDRFLDYCAYECFAPAGDAHYTVLFPFIENDYNYQILLSFGDQCECLEPLPIRAEVKRRVQAMAALYEDERDSAT
jgi:predicted DNA-binding transcriptional regulator YafY